MVKDRFYNIILDYLYDFWLANATILVEVQNDYFLHLVAMFQSDAPVPLQEYIRTELKFHLPRISSLISKTDKMYTLRDIHSLATGAFKKVKKEDIRLKN